VPQSHGPCYRRHLVQGQQAATSRRQRGWSGVRDTSTASPTPSCRFSPPHGRLALAPPRRQGLRLAFAILLGIRSLSRDPRSAAQTHRMRPRQTLARASLRSLVGIRSLSRDPRSAAQTHRMRPRQTLARASLRARLLSGTALFAHLREHPGSCSGFRAPKLAPRLGCSSMWAGVCRVPAAPLCFHDRHHRASLQCEQEREITGIPKGTALWRGVGQSPTMHA
jgi:hypothetical protein